MLNIRIPVLRCSFVTSIIIIIAHFIFWKYEKRFLHLFIEIFNLSSIFHQNFWFKRKSHKYENETFCPDLEESSTLDYLLNKKQIYSYLTPKTQQTSFILESVALIWLLRTQICCSCFKKTIQAVSNNCIDLQSVFFGQGWKFNDSVKS